MPQELCPKCRGTGFASVGKNGVRGVVRCGCVKVSRSGRLMDEARIPARYAHCQLEGFGLTHKWRNESLERAKSFAETCYAESKTTILTTNYLDQEDLKSSRKSVSYSLTERIREPMRSRLYEVCKSGVMQGEDFRQKHKSEEHRP
jgi:hypothetical protein